MRIQELRTKLSTEEYECFLKGNIIMLLLSSNSSKNYKDNLVLLREYLDLLFEIHKLAVLAVD